MRRMFVNDEFKDMADARQSRGMIGMVRHSSLVSGVDAAGP